MIKGIGSIISDERVGSFAMISCVACVVVSRARARTRERKGKVTGVSRTALLLPFVDAHNTISD